MSAPVKDELTERFRCHKCLKPKPLDAFRVDPTGRRGTRCRVCVAAGRAGGAGERVILMERWRDAARRGNGYCLRCHVEMPAAEFGIVRVSMAASSSAKRTDYYCKPCRKQKNRERKAQILSDPARKARRLEQDRISQRKRWLKVRYGLTPEEYCRILTLQRGRCAMCGSGEPEGQGWAVDHSHLDNHNRGLLNSNCNTGIGLLGDTLQGVIRAVVYLARDELGDIGPDGWWPVIRKMMFEHITYMNSLPALEFAR